MVVVIAYAGSFDACKVPGVSEYTPPSSPALSGDSKDYNGHMTVFIVAKVSDYIDYGGTRYYHGFLDYGYDASFTLAPGDSINTTYSWDADAAGFGSYDSANLMAIVAIKDMSHGYAQSSDTVGGSGAPFTAYYTDAAASATIDEQHPNVVNDDYTHSVFAEVGTATTCPSCPTMNNNMHLIQEYYDYPFHYCEMVVDENTLANSRLNGQFNLYWVPTTYYDDGYRVVVGGHGLGTIIYEIDNCGQRAVPSYGLTITFNSTAKGTYGGEISLRENSHPDIPADPTGVVEGATDIAYEYITAGATDPENDPLSYQFMMGDSLTEWIGPYFPPDPCSVFYTWPEAGTFDVKVKSKDKYGFESDWSAPLSVLIHSYVAGDANNDNTVNIFDVTYVISNLYMEGPDPIPVEAGDANGSGLINIFDVTHLISFLYMSGPPPVYP
jgi:hypothetical protein